MTPLHNLIRPVKSFFFRGFSPYLLAYFTQVSSSIYPELSFAGSKNRRNNLRFFRTKQVMQEV
jgi:hypothetical protein